MRAGGVVAASIKDVARVAGVSLGTVSNVLNRPDIVRPETRAKVAAAIAALGYVRNDSARQLRAGVSRTIAFVVLDAANPFFTDVARGMDDVARANDLIVYLCDSNDDVTRESDFLEQLLQQRVRGVCITPVAGEGPMLAELEQRGIPVVIVDRLPPGEQRWCSVGVDDVLGGELAAAHLLQRGHQGLAFVGTGGGILQADERLAGVRRAIEQADSGTSLQIIDTAGLTVADGRAAGAQLLALPRRNRPTAVACANDLLALGVLQEMQHNRIRVPSDVAIVGYDDIDFVALAAVPLTTIRQPRHLLGRAAVALLLAEAEPDHVHRHVEYQPELVIRASSGG